ncbi:MAG: phenylalanine--tRNA ligase subunit alpha [Candidatus Nanoarchaeia archaeon]|nr:phenylalanine--tRNA ligase subunit alpha [Candidatus Nanoarchaeia archaeon]
MEITKIAESLHPLERKIVPLLKNNITDKELEKKSKLSYIEVSRALQWLENKEIIKIKQELKEVISLDKNGERYLKNNLPEKAFLEAIKDHPLPLNEIETKAKLDKQELNISVGLLKKHNYIEFKEGKLSITQKGKEFIKDDSEIKFLKSLPLEVSKLDKKILKELSERKEIIKTDTEKTKVIELTDLGEKITKVKLDENLIESVTQDMLKDSSWKNKKFRRYDIKLPVPKIYPGKRHFVNQVNEYTKRIWLDLGFKEMTGPLLNTSFWNFDALFTAQDHPVREMQDTFFIKNPRYGNLPDKKLVNSVKEVHEGTSELDSLGWQYSWDENEAKRNVLRTHTTVLSARTLNSLEKEDLPLKFFAVGKCFRNETLDWSHLFEFNQTEGIVIDKNANFRHLLGYLKQFFKKMGYEKARFRPAYFPYTEFSVEIDIFDTQRQRWIELGGAGILRPEVVVPLLGEDIPVLAWGPGVDRIMTAVYKLKDVRELYKNDLKQLREIKIWMK